MPGQSGAGQGAWVVLTGGCGCPRWVEWLGAGLAAVAVNRVVLIWKLVRTNIFDHTGSRPVAEVYIAPRAVEWLIRKLFGAKQRHQLGVILRTYFKE